MGRIVFLLLFFAALGAGARETYNMNAGWHFFSGDAVSSDGARMVSVPHTCQSVGNYLKELDMPEEWVSGRVFIKGYGGGPIVEVFVNGHFAGENRGGYTTWQFEITELLQPKTKNSIHIICTASARFDVLPTAGDGEVPTGLFRDVELVVTGREAIEEVAVIPGEVTEQRAAGEVRVTAQGEAKVVIRDRDGRVVSRGKDFSIENPLLWHGRRNPELYEIEVATGDDTVRLMTGFRSVEVDPSRGFLLNGEEYPLRGVVVRGEASSRRQAAEDVALILEMGANAVHIEGVAAHPAFYDMCDREGIVVRSDFPLLGEAFLTDKAYLPTETFEKNGLEQSLEIVRQQRNHPCVVMWGLFSNLQARGDNPLDFIRRLNEAAHNEDPSRLTAASSNIDGELNFAPDIICWAHHFGWNEGRPEDVVRWKEHFFAEWNNMRSAVSYGAGGSVLHQEPSPRRPDPLGVRHPERWQTRLHEIYYDLLKDEKRLWGLFIRNMFDYPAPRITWGESGVNDFGLVTADRKVRKDAFYFYKAQWNTVDPFVYISERRWVERPSAQQTITVFSNAEEVELFVNGVSAGVRRGRFVWENLSLRRGTNTIEARAGELSDRTSIEIRDDEREI